MKTVEFNAATVSKKMCELLTEFCAEKYLQEMSVSCGFIEFPNGRKAEVQLTMQVDDDQLILDPDRQPTLILKKSHFPMTNLPRK